MRNKNLIKYSLIVFCIVPVSVLARSSIESRLIHLEKVVNQNSASNFSTLERRIADLEKALIDANKRIETQNKLLNELVGPSREQQYLLSSNKSARADSTISLEDQKNKFIYCVELANNKQYKEAIAAFDDFIWQDPNGPYASSSHYWLAELYLMLWNMDKTNISSKDKAIEEFSLVYKRYPQDLRAPDCLLKLGLIKYDDQKWREAKDIFTKVIQEYDQTSVSRIAKTKLDLISKSGKY